MDILGDKIRNEIIQGKLGVTSVADKMKITRLQRFGRVKRKSVYVSVRRCKRINLGVTRRVRGRPKSIGGGD